MSTRNETRFIVEVLGKGLDFLFYVAAFAFLVAFFYEPARSSSVLVLATGVFSLTLGLGYVLLK